MSVEPEKKMKPFKPFAPAPGTEPTEIKGIVRHPQVLGGKPAIEGHRIAVHDIAAHIRQGYTPEQIASEDVYPTLTLAEVYAALHYYYNHQEQIDREIVEEDAEVKRLAQKDMSPLAQKIRQAIKERKEKLAQEEGA